MVLDHIKFINSNQIKPAVSNESERIKLVICKLVIYINNIISNCNIFYESGKGELVNGGRSYQIR